MDGDDWARAFLAVEVKPHASEAVRELFAVARGAAVYGWFFYPVFFLAEEQLHRVVEAAARDCYHHLGGTDRLPRFADSIALLIQHGVIPHEDEERWQAARWLRNQASHPTRQAVMTPGAILRMFKQAAHDINRLYARTQIIDTRQAQRALSREVVDSVRTSAGWHSEDGPSRSRRKTCKPRCRMPLVDAGLRRRCRVTTEGALRETRGCAIQLTRQASRRSWRSCERQANGLKVCG